MAFPALAVEGVPDESSAWQELARLEPDDALAACGTSQQGLSVEEAARRLARYGPNRIPAHRPVPWWSRLLANYTHTMALLLWVGGALALGAGLPQLAVAVWAVNVLNGLFSFWQEHKAERATEALQRLLPLHARVVRGGVEVDVLGEELVPGDVMLLEEGDRICADGRVIDVTELRVDQSTLTGESRPRHRTAAPLDVSDVAVDQRKNWVFAGTSVSSGRGKVVVAATGRATEFGSLVSLTQSIGHDRSPLQRELERVSHVVGAIAVGVGAAFFVIAELLTPLETGRGFVFALGMIVAFVPEGLLPTVTLSLAMATQRMARRQALVRRLAAVEALGSTTVICTDKTGTLTENEMTVRALWLPEGTVQVTGEGYEPDGELQIPDRVDEGAVEALLTAGALVNDARLLPPDPTGAGGWSLRGDPTEGALLVVAAKAGIDLASATAAAPRLAEVPFEPSRRRMSTLHRDARGGAVLYVKGGPSEVLARCTAVRIGERVEPLDEELRARVLRADISFAQGALRVLAVAERRFDLTPPLDRPADLEDELVLLGLVGMLDPPRPEVADAIATCRRAGIRVLMMTGDQGATAQGVARQVGLSGSTSARVVEGAELDVLDDDALQSLLAEDVVLARTTPAHKLRVVTALQQAGHVVAVTGDGVNDAPALKRADVGVAMGRAGTDVAREAADVVLLDDNFATIVAAVEEGRAVYANIRKFSGYIFTSNAPEALPFIVFGLTGGRVPPALDVMHILAVDLGTDLLPALALGAEPPEPGIMAQPPRRRDEHAIDRSVLVRSYLVLGPVQALIVVTAFYARYWIEGYGGQWLDLPGSGRLYESATALALATVVATQVGNLLAHRTEKAPSRQRSLGQNPLIIWGVLAEIVLIVLIVYAPPLRSWIGTAPFPWWLWLVVAATSPALLLVDEARKRWLHGDGPPEPSNQGPVSLSRVAT